MRRIYLLFTLTAATALLADACDRGESSTEPFAGGANGLVGDEIIGEIETPLDAKEDPSLHPIEVEWTDGAASTDSPSVSFSLTNKTTAAIEYSVSLFAKSLIGEAERPIGAGAIDPGESESYELNASELPLLSDKVVGSLSVRIRRVEALPGGEREVVEDRATRFFVHSVGYESVRAFDENTLRDERDGTLVSLPNPKSGAIDPTEIVGDAWDGVGYSARAAGDSGLLLRDEGGEAYAIINEMRLDSALPTETAEATPDEGEVAETEVDDE